MINDKDELKNVEWINAKQRFIPKPRLEPQIDVLISKIVGKKIYIHDPRLIKLICKWKKGKSPDSMEPDDFFRDERKIKELREVLGQEFT